MASEQSSQDLRTARHRAGVSIFLNLALATGKGLAGVLSGSTALIGDAIHSGTDVLASLATYVGLWVAGQEHPSFPYGLYKAETVATLITSIAVIVAGYEIGRQALFGTEAMPDTRIALPVAAASLLVALGFGLYQLREGKRLNSPAVQADANDYLADALSTAVVLIGLLAVKLGYNVDRWAAAVVSLFVFRAGGSLLFTALRGLLDAAMDRETEREIIEMVERHPRITRVKQCLSRTVGGRFIVDLDVIMHTPSHKLADHVADRLEELIPRRFPLVVMARIRPHFSTDGTIRRIVPYESPRGERSSHFSSAPWFLIETVKEDGGQVTGREFVENPHAREARKRGLLVGQWLLRLKPDEVVVPEEKRKTTAAVLLQEAGVELLVPDSTGNGRSGGQVDNPVGGEPGG